MHMKIIFAITFIFVSGVSSSALFRADVAPDTMRDVRKCNIYVDQLLQEMAQKRGQELDPIRLPDSEIVLGLRMFGTAELFNKVIEGLSNVYRNGDCQILMNGRDHVVSVPVRVTTLRVQSLVKVDHEWMGQTFLAKAKVPFVELDLVMDVDRDIGMPMIDKLIVTVMPDLYFEDSRPKGVLDTLFNLLLKVLSGYWREAIKDSVLTHLYNSLEYMINEESPLLF